MTGVKKNPYCPLRRSVVPWDECPMGEDWGAGRTVGPNAEYRELGSAKKVVNCNNCCIAPQDAEGRQSPAGEGQSAQPNDSMAQLFSLCACGSEYLQRIPRRTWMRLFPGRLHYRCSVCKQHHLVSAHKVDEARASQASKGAYRQE
jgi:hypothetical protein